MSDLTAANCGCNNNCGCGNNSSCGLGNGSNWIWIILLLCCGGNGLCGNSGCSSDCDNSCGGGCDILIWILLLSCICGNGNGFC